VQSSSNPTPRQTYAATRRVLAAVERAEPHLSYEELAGWVDRSLSPDDHARCERHVAHCVRCAHELNDLVRAAPLLAAPLRTPGESPGFAARLRAWMGEPRALGAMTAAVAVAVAVGVIWQAGGGVTGAPDDKAAMHVDAGPSSMLDAMAFDESALTGLGALSPAAQVALQAHDWAALVKVLRPVAQAGNAQAQTALGLLYAEGRGVVADSIRATYWWGIAAPTNASARRNLALLQARTPAAPSR
jgi:TPR repeat protein